MENFVPTTVSLIITGLISVVIGVYLEKFKTRLTILKYRLFSHPLATSAQDAYWGDISVSYNGNRINHLSFITIDILNESNKDLSDVNIDIWVDSNSQILSHSGFYLENGNAVLLEEAHYNYIQQVLIRSDEDSKLRMQYAEHVTPKQLQDELRWVFTNRKFNLPILNRHTSVRLNILVENFQGLIPEARVSILRESVKLVRQQDEADENRKLGVNMILWGVLIFVVGIGFLAYRYDEAQVPLLFAGILGVSYLLVGLVIYRVIRFVKNYFA